MSSSISDLARAAGLTLALTLAGAAAAQQAPLSAQDSDPRVLGWMQGFPPPTS